MTKEEIAKWAYADDKPEAPMNCAERSLWYAMRDIYRGFASGLISREQGDAEKRRAFKQFEKDMGEIEHAQKILTFNSTMWAEIELAAYAYNMNKTIENADAFIRAVYGVKHKAADTA